MKSRATSRSLSFCLQLVSLVAEQLIGDEEITGWKIALKEIHAALNKQVSLMLVGNPIKTCPTQMLTGYLNSVKRCKHFLIPVPCGKKK